MFEPLTFPPGNFDELMQSVLRTVTIERWLDKAPLQDLISRAPVCRSLATVYDKISALVDGGLIDSTDSVSNVFAEPTLLNAGCSIQDYLQRSNCILDVHLPLSAFTFDFSLIDCTMTIELAKQESVVVEFHSEYDDDDDDDDEEYEPVRAGMASKKRASMSATKYAAMNNWFFGYGIERPAISDMRPMLSINSLAVIVRVPNGTTGYKELDKVQQIKKYMSPVVSQGQGILVYIAIEHSSVEEACNTLTMWRQFCNRKAPEMSAFSIDYIRNFFLPDVFEYTYPHGIVPGVVYRADHPHPLDFTDLTKSGNNKKKKV